jgi:hypothetical protein
MGGGDSGVATAGPIVIFFCRSAFLILFLWHRYFASVEACPCQVAVEASGMMGKQLAVFRSFVRSFWLGVLWFRFQWAVLSMTDKRCLSCGYFTCTKLSYDGTIFFVDVQYIRNGSFISMLEDVVDYYSESGSGRAYVRTAECLEKRI